MTSYGAELAGENVLVSGATGFIGAHLVNRLVALGARVHGVTRGEGPEGGPVRWWRGDLSDREFVRSVLGEVRPAYVFHLASRVAGGRGVDMVFPTFDANLVSTVNLLVGAADTSVRRIVLAGSMEEADEASAVPVSPYAAAKAAASAYARMFHALYATPVVVARIFMVYGPAQADTKKLVPYATLSFLAGQAPELASGTRPVDWVYVDDVVDGLLVLATADGVEGETVELGSGVLVTVREVVERLAVFVGTAAEPAFGAVSDRALERVRVARVEETETRVGWRARVPLDEGLRRTVDWYRERNEDTAISP